MVTWEYKAVNPHTRNEAELEEKLNQLGAQGWELVTIAAPPILGAPGASELVAILKRPRSQT